MALPIICNVAKGRIAHYASLPATDDALIAVPLEAAGLESDSALVDYDNLADLLAASNNEQTTMGRKTLAAVTVTINDTDNRVVIDCDDIFWLTAGGNPVGAVVICYDPDTLGGADSDIIPLGIWEMIVTPGGGTITFEVNAAGLMRAS